MLKLKKIHILGFKSFCDRTELALPGTGIAVVVGPNGCGKSNILDGVTWVLGEQSAKTLRGAHMMDVIFAGTRDRKALGMAEVTITMVDPEAYEGPMIVAPEIDVESDLPVDWDEAELRKRRANEADEIIAENQPGQALDEETEGLVENTPAADAAQAGGPQNVVLEDSTQKVFANAAKGRDCDHAAALQDGRERISAEWEAVPAAGYSGHLYGHGPGAGELRDYRAGADWAAVELEAA